MSVTKDPASADPPALDVPSDSAQGNPSPAQVDALLGEQGTLIPLLPVDRSEEELRFWSVTTLMGEAMGKGEGIIQWSMARVAERAFDQATVLGGFYRQWQATEDPEQQKEIRKAAVRWMKDARWDKLGKAADRGKGVHKLIEAYALGQKPDVPDGLLPYDEQVRKFLSDHAPEIEMAEAPVYHPQFKYAGQLDLILKIQGLRLVTDAKTTDKAPPEIDPEVHSRPPYPEIAIQLVAYSRCTHVGVSPATERTYHGRRYYIYDPGMAYVAMPKIDGALALVISPYDYQLVPVRIDDEIWRVWGFVREMARWSIETSKVVLGSPVAPSVTPA